MDSARIVNGISGRLTPVDGGKARVVTVEDSIQKKISFITVNIHAIEKLVAGGADIVCFQYPTGAKFPLGAKEPVVDLCCAVVRIVGVGVGSDSNDAIVRIEPLP